MQPASDIPAATRAAVRGVVFDIDDTVTRGGRLEPESFAALWSLARAGLRLIAVTGRPLGWCDVVAHHWPIDLAVGENGAGWVWVQDGRLYQGYFDPPEERARQAQQLQRVRDDVAQRMPRVQRTADGWARRCDLAFDIGEAVQLPSQQVAQLTALIEEHGARTLVSTVHAHAMFADWDKASGVVRAAAEVLGQDLADPGWSWLFVGDSANDASAFAHFPLSVGVQNVRDHLAHLPAPPRYVTAGDRGRGFAELTHLLLGARNAGSSD